MSLINDALKRTKQVQQQAAPASTLSPEGFVPEPEPQKPAPSGPAPGTSPPSPAVSAGVPSAPPGSAPPTIAVPGSVPPKTAGPAPLPFIALKSASSPVPPLPPLVTASTPAKGSGSTRLAAIVGLVLVALVVVWAGVRFVGHSSTVTAAAAQDGSATDQTAAPAANGNPAPVPSTEAGRAAVAAIKGPIVAAESAATKALANWRPQEPAAQTGETANASAPSATGGSKADSTTSSAASAASPKAPPAPPPIRLQGIVDDPSRPSAMINGKTLFVGDMLGVMQVVAISPNSATLVGAGQTNLLTLR